MSKEQFLKTDLKVLHQLRTKSNDLYYNTDNTGGISDEVYDILIDVIKLKEKDDSFQNPVGSTVKHNPSKLPYYLGSMNKCREQKEIQKWKQKYLDKEYLIEDKLDGVSCLLIIDNNDTIKLYTRGDGLIGSDISHFISHFQNIPNKNIPLPKPSLAVRGELIMKKSTFNMKYKDKFANSRNLISGIINSKTIKEEANDIDFIPYEIISSKETTPSILKQIDILKTIFPIVVNHKVLPAQELSQDKLVESLMDMKSMSDYDIDGIIVHSTQSYQRNTSSNPDYAFAFKTTLSDNVMDTEVEYVEWNVTKWNVYKPRIKIKPVNLCGVTIHYTSGHNAKYIKDNNIGPGAIVTVTRSNDVIPYILQVKQPASIITYPPYDEFKWNDSGVDIIVTNPISNSTADIKTISSFFAELGIKQISDCTITKMFESGYNTLPKILSASKEDFAQIDGFGDKLAERTVTNLHTILKQCTIDDIISSSSCFGFGIGKKKIQKLIGSVDLLSEGLEDDGDILIAKISTLDGFSEKTAQQIVSHIPQMKQLVSELSPYLAVVTKETKEDKKNVNCGNKLIGQTIVFSGFRDKDLENLIVSEGGTITSSVTKNTTMVITKDMENNSSKIKKAIEYKTTILQKDNFIKKFFI